MTSYQKLKRKNQRLKNIIFKYWYSVVEAKQCIQPLCGRGVSGDSLLFGFEESMVEKSPEEAIKSLYLHKKQLKEGDIK